MSIDNASRPQPLPNAAPVAPRAAARPATAQFANAPAAARPATQAGTPQAAAQQMAARQAAASAAQNQSAEGEEEEDANPQKQVLWQSFLASQASLLVHTVILIVLGTMNFAEPEIPEPMGNVVMDTPEKAPVIEPIKEEVADIPKDNPVEAPMIKDLQTANTQGGSGPVSSTVGLGGDGVLGDISGNDGDKLAGPVLAVGRVNPNVSDAAFSSTGIPTLPRSGEGGTGRRTTGVPKGGTTFFGKAATGNRFVFVIDNSGSMDGGRFEMAAAELLKSVKQLKDTDLFYVIFFSGRAFALFHPDDAPRLVPATAKNKKRFEEWLNNAPLGNSTRGEEALAKAFELHPDHIFLLGDGEFTDKASDITVKNADKYKEENPGIKMSTLGFNMQGRGRDSFIAIAQSFEGVFTDVKVEPAMVDLAVKKKRVRTDQWPPAPPAP